MKNQSLLLLTATLVPLLLSYCRRQKPVTEALWSAPDTATIPHNEQGRLIRYGRALIANTAHYLGPEGIVRPTSNGMNCQNCHLAAGTVPWGNHYGAAAATYPKFRERSGTVESLEKKINDCIERSLNGTPIDSNSLEMRAMVAYMRWLGQDVPKGNRPRGSGITPLPYPAFAASPEKGSLVYREKCTPCHGVSGQGKRRNAAAGYEYPPLWGSGSFNTGAGIYRLSKMAGFIRSNMPLGARYDKPVLSEEEAWHVAAFIVSQNRPDKKFPGDWPDIRTKPVDHPFGPFPDSFSSRQHQFGPFGPIEQAHHSSSTKN